MTDFYKKMQNIATGVLKGFNQGEIYYVKMVPVAGATPDDPGESQPSRTLLPGATVKAVENRFVDGTTILSSDSQITSSVVEGLDPCVGDNTDIDGTEYTVVGFLPIPAAGTPVVYKIFVRR